MKRKILFIIIGFLFAADISAQPPNNTIFGGGSGDGWNFKSFTGAAGNIFVGGSGDGWNNSSFSINANSIFLGGSGDGWNYNGNNVTANSIFSGGVGGGWHNSSFNPPPNSIFIGGIGDGWHFNNFSLAPNSIFKGGIGDGWSNSTLPVIPNLGNDTTVYILCANDTRRIDTLYNTTGLITNWSTDPLAAPLGTHTLIATSSFGYSDTALVFVMQEVAVWVGTISSNWHDTANWNHGKVPTLTVHVIIPAGTANPCEISNADAEAASVQALSGNLSIVNNRRLFIAANCPTLPVAQ